MIWTETYRVEAHDVDMTGAFRVAAMMRYMQETAYRHMQGTGPTETELRAAGRAFLLSRIAVRIYETIGHGDEFTLETYAEESRGVSFGRVFTIRSVGRLIAEARSVWVLFDFSARRIMRVGEIEHLYGEEPPHEMEVPRRLLLPEGVELSSYREHLVDYPDIDVNGHMNNTVYADILCGCVPEIRSGDARVSYLYINYSNECKLDENIKIERCGQPGEWFFRTHRDDGRLNVEARVETV